MNKIRRKQLQEASELIAKAQGIIESVKDDEQEAHDNLPTTSRKVFSTEKRDSRWRNTLICSTKHTDSAVI